MKKLIMSLILSAALFAGASAQTTQDKTPVQTTHKVKTTGTKTAGTKMDTKVKSKPTTTVPQKVNNIVRPKHKKYSGHKTKEKTGK